MFDTSRPPDDMPESGVGVLYLINYASTLIARRPLPRLIRIPHRLSCYDSVINPANYFDCLRPRNATQATMPQHRSIGRDDMESIMPSKIIVGGCPVARYNDVIIK